MNAGVRATVRASASAKRSLWGPVSAAPNLKRLTVSTPAATKTSPSPASDGVGGHADGLQGGGAVAVDGDAGDVGEPGQDGGHPADVVAGLATGLPGAHEDVFDLLGIELRHLGQDFFDDEPGQIVGPTVDQGALVRSADGGPSSGDDDSFGHSILLEVVAALVRRVVGWPTGRSYRSVTLATGHVGQFQTAPDQATGVVVPAPTDSERRGQDPAKTSSSAGDSDKAAGKGDGFRTGRLL